MTCMDGTSMGLDSHEPRDRLARYLRRQYAEGHATKRLAREIDCTPKTAENILNGCWPNSRHWLNIVRAFGKDVTDAVFHPDDAAARLELEVIALERQLSEARARAADMAGVSPVRPSRVAALQDRSAR